MAKAFPSTGAYLDSAPLVNLLPANTVGQPVLQQPGTLALHPQCFWVRWNPIPVLLQSVPRAVVQPVDLQHKVSVLSLLQRPRLQLGFLLLRLA